MPIDLINDPKSLCKEIDRGARGSNEILVELSMVSQIEDAMELVRQSFEEHKSLQLSLFDYFGDSSENSDN